MNSIETKSGERLSFHQLFAEKEYRIEVPIIQRDYAQGRSSSLDVRNTFLDALYNYLEEDKKHRDLDFIYGSLKGSAVGNKFIPLDGQQRLTTLYLLHWYLAHKDNQFDDFKKVLFDGKSSKFTYETRTSSREFCNALLTNSIDLQNLLESDKDKENSLSKTIMDKHWYFLSWKDDPTIKAMLTMLDSIHGKFKGSFCFYNRLIREETPVITFQFLNLDEFKLTDDLYIKMNSRGKPLTSFENFKARFEQHIKKLTFSKKPTKYTLHFGGNEESVSVRQYFSHKIDTDWANLFWNYRDENYGFDDKIMNFIRSLAIGNEARKSKNSSVIKALLDKKKENISFNQYLEFSCFDEDFILELINLLDLLKNGEDPVKIYLSNSRFYQEREVFEKNIIASTDTFYVQRIKFFAYYKYLLLWNNIEGLEAWMRVISNLTENTAPYNDEQEFSRSIRAVEQLLPYSNEILLYLSKHGKQLDGFNDKQFKEEILKAKLILKNKSWSNLIEGTEEQLQYFKGQLTSLLVFSGIYKSYENDLELNWTPDVEENLKSSFLNYRRKMNPIFSSDKIPDFESELWRRAIFSKGFYLIPEGSNHSFLIDSDRDISWKRLLLGDKDGGKEKRDYLWKLIDDPRFDPSHVEESLRTIVEAAKKEITNWRKYFIRYPEILSDLGPKKYIRFRSNKEIYLLKGERISGTYREYYSYGFFLAHLQQKSFPPFNKTRYHEVNGEGQTPCAVIEEWKLGASNFTVDISFDHTSKEYKMEFFDRNDSIYENSMIELMKENNMAFDPNIDRFYRNISEEDLIVELPLLISSLNDYDEKQEAIAKTEDQDVIRL